MIELERLMTTSFKYEVIIGGYCGNSMTLNGANCYETAMNAAMKLINLLFQIIWEVSIWQLTSLN